MKIVEYKLGVPWWKQQHGAHPTSDNKPTPPAMVEKKIKKKALLIGCQQVRQEPAEVLACATGSAARLKRASIMILTTFLPVFLNLEYLLLLFWPGKTYPRKYVMFRKWMMLGITAGLMSTVLPSTAKVTKKDSLKGPHQDLKDVKVTKKDLLKGPHQDVKAMRDLLIEVYKYDPADIVVLVDDDHPTHKQPTQDNIMDEMKKLVEGAVEHDRFFFHFSGHSVQEDTDDIEEEDRKNEFILTSDGKKIKDDVLKATLVDPLPKNSSLIAVFDSCHSGTLLDLKHFRCNRVYIPWVNKGSRRSFSRWIATGRRQAKISTRDQPPIMRIMAQNARWAQTSLDRVLLPNKESITPQMLHDPLAHPPSLHVLPLSSKTKTSSLIAGFQTLSSPSTKPMWLESPTAGEKQCSSPVDLYCSGFCRGHALSPDNTKVLADVVLISSAKDSQLTWEDPTGASMTQSLVKILRKDPHPSYTDLMKLVSHDIHAYYVGLHARAQEYRKMVREKNCERIKKGKMPKESVKAEMNNFQNPQLSSDRPWNMDRQFYP